MASRVNISTARRELPALFNRVTSRDGAKVVIGRRDGGREAVLASREYVERLEVAERRVGRGTSFRVMGSATIVGTVEEVLGEIRAEQAGQRAKRLAELTIPPSSRSAR